MPTHIEETALLGMESVELSGIVHHIGMLRIGEDLLGCTKIRVPTDRGDILVAVLGDRSKPAIVAYHDIGLNYLSFQTFFNYVDMRALLQNFCVYHVNAPGQEEGAATLPQDYEYPTMDQLAYQLNFVLTSFGLRSCIGFGVGAGAYILAKFALNHPDKVDALVLVNCTSTQISWTDWVSFMMSAKTLRSNGLTDNVMEHLMYHNLGRFPDNRNKDLVATYQNYFRRVNPKNLAMLMESYRHRSDLGIQRSGNTLQVPVLNITAADSPHIEDTVVFNGRLNPNNSTWMKISDCGNVLEEKPATLAEAFRLFVQGEGFAVLALHNLAVGNVQTCGSNNGSFSEHRSHK